MEWKGSVAIVTGASRGIGAAVARAAAAKGARVGLIARAKDELDAVLASCGGDGAVAVADAADRLALEGAIAEVERALGPADILVNNAGIGGYGKIADMDVEEFERMMRVNYFGTVYATKAVLPGMLQRRRGHIVMLASIAGRLGAPLEGGYSASKFAMAGFTEALGFEAGAHGVGVSMINPGPVETEFFNARGAPYERKHPKPVSAEAVARLVVRAVERGTAEAFIPKWLRFPVVLKSLAPPLYRTGTARNFGRQLR